MKVLVLGDEKKGDVRHLLGPFVEWLRSRADIVGVDLSRDTDLAAAGADIVVAFGGDGTILGAARRMGDHQIPTLGVNLGRLGFLSETTLADARQTVEQALAGELVEDPRLMLSCIVERAGQPPLRTLALNDAVITRQATGPMLRIAAWAGSRYVTTYAGDGVIVASPVGSTAYSLAAGGPIVFPDMDVLVLSPLASHALTVRPLVIPAGPGVSLSLEHDTEPLAVFVADGQVTFPIEPGDLLRVEPAPQKFRLLTPPTESFFEILRRKFGWAGSPKYEEREREEG